MSGTLLSIALVVMAFCLKMTAVTLGAASLRRLCPDSVASWLASWLALHTAIICAMLGLSAVGQLSTTSAWGLLIFACSATGVVAWRRSSLNLGRGIKEGALGCSLFACVFLIMAARAAVYQDFTWDAQTYGLVRLGLWMNYGSILVHMPTIQLNAFTNEWNGELIALLYGLAAGSIQGLMFGAVEILAVTFLSATWLAFRLGARPFWASLVGTAIAATPACLGLTGVIKGDLLAATALLMGAGWLTVLASHPLVAGTMFIASLALAVGSKITTVFAALGLVAIALISARKAHWPSLLRGGAIGLAMSTLLLSRNIANFVVYGDPLKRIAGESAQPGLQTLTNALDFIAAQTFRFSIVQAGMPAFGWLLSAGMGMTMFLAGGALLAQWVSGIRPSTIRLSLIVVALMAVCVTAFLTPTYPWSFRYYLPMLLVVAVALMAFPISAAGSINRSILVVGAIVGIAMNCSYVFWPGEINANNTFAAAFRAAWAITPHGRALLILPSVREAYGVDEFGFDGGVAKTFVVLAEFDRPVSPMIGSRAQNRLYLASSVPELVESTRMRCPDFVVITKRQPANVPDADKAAVEALGYSFMKESGMAAIARRSRQLCSGARASSSTL